MIATKIDDISPTYAFSLNEHKMGKQFSDMLSKKLVKVQYNSSFDSILEEILDIYGDFININKNIKLFYR